MDILVAMGNTAVRAGKYWAAKPYLRFDEKLWNDLLEVMHKRGFNMVVDDYVENEWAMIPHFYNAYYVFQYATSFTASSALSEKVLSGEPGTTQRYLAFISGGHSKYPIELLKDAGVDMTTDEPLELTVQKMNRVMDQMESMLEKTDSRRKRRSNEGSFLESCAGSLRSAPPRKSKNSTPRITTLGMQPASSSQRVCR